MGLKEDLLADARAFQKSRIILAAAELDLFTQIHAGPARAEELASTLGLDVRATTRLLDALVVTGLLTKDRGNYHTTSQGELLSDRHPQNIRPIVLHMSHQWFNWSHLTDAVRQGKNPHRKSAAQQTGEILNDFIGAMHAIGAGLSREVARDYDTARFHCLLDIGGGSGTYTLAFLNQNPNLKAVLFDLPAVMPLAEERLRSAGLTDRVKFVPGDFYRDELPGDCDLALLSAIIHQNSPQQNLELYRKLHRALASDGVLLIRDHVMEEDRIHPPTGALFALNMLVSTEGGDTFTFAEIEKALRHAGFSEVTLVRRGETMDGLVEARKTRG